jgi:hypothetical protein
MIPAVRVPADAKIRTPIEIKLKAGWEFDAARRLVVSERGEEFEARDDDLPKKSKIVHKTPALAQAARKARARMSADENNLLRYLQVILPADETPAKYLKTIRDWPWVEQANLPPQPSLPGISV